jgi:hypothetical protein
MNSADQRLFELALKKQRVQFESERLRQRVSNELHGVLPVFEVLDAVGSGIRWLKQRPAIPVGIAVAAIVARPRAIFRWGRRAVVGWQAWRKVRDLLNRPGTSAPR